MKIVLDTNILLQSLPRNSKFRPIWDAFLNYEFELVITPSILLEYEEIIAQKTSPQVSTNVVALLQEAVNTVLIHIHYEWNIMTNDPDDNKFFDASVAGNANYLVTNDKHFKQALAIEFPKINVIDSVQFLAVLGKSIK
jgi:uncharacterized protein